MVFPSIPVFYLKTKVFPYLKALSSVFCVKVMLRLGYIFVFLLTRFFSKITWPLSVFVLFSENTLEPFVGVKSYRVSSCSVF